ncbi:hypothetical protein Lal_00016333 [Lupinus albus]|nr:hypothetical protein Lal_00016333 [Lupinus albus]
MKFVNNQLKDAEKQHLDSKLINYNKAFIRRNGAVSVNIIVAAHHLLKLIKVHVTVTVGIHRFDHTVTFLDGTLHPEAVQHKVKLRSGDEAILVLILRRTTVGATEGAKLGKVDEAVVVGVEILHNALEFRGGYGGAERAEDGVKLRDGDLAIAVCVEATEDSLEFVDVHVLEGPSGWE